MKWSNEEAYGPMPGRRDDDVWLTLNDVALIWPDYQCQPFFYYSAYIQDKNLEISQFNKKISQNYKVIIQVQ